MSVTTAEKAKVIAEHQRVKGDTGSPEVQIALLTARINGLNDHFKDHLQAPRLPEAQQRRQLQGADREARPAQVSAEHRHPGRIARAPADRRAGAAT